MLNIVFAPQLAHLSQVYRGNLGGHSWRQIGPTGGLCAKDLVSTVVNGLQMKKVLPRSLLQSLWPIDCHLSLPS